MQGAACAGASAAVILFATGQGWTEPARSSPESAQPAASKPACATCKPKARNQAEGRQARDRPLSRCERLRLRGLDKHRPPWRSGDGEDDCSRLQLPSPGAYHMFSTFTLLATLTHVEEHDVQPGGALGSMMLGYLRPGNATGRMRTDMWIGGDTAGLQGGMRLDLALGWTGATSGGFGPLVRGGLRAEFSENKRLYTSLLGIPQLQAGVHGFSRHWYGELVGLAGPLLIGYYNPADAHRRLGPSAAWGVRWALGHAAAFLEVEWLRAQPASFEPSTPVDMLSTMLCGELGRVGLCIEARRYRGEVELGDEEIEQVTSTAAALSVGGPIPCPD
jgi:hypothetical protein